MWHYINHIATRLRTENDMTTARKITETTNRTLWDVLMDNGKCYGAVTYPNSERLYIENGNGRPIYLKSEALQSVAAAIAKAREVAAYAGRINEIPNDLRQNEAWRLGFANALRQASEIAREADIEIARSSVLTASTSQPARPTRNPCKPPCKPPCKTPPPT